LIFRAEYIGQVLSPHWLPRPDLRKRTYNDGALRTLPDFAALVYQNLR